ncbi:MAG: NAD-dependent deacylase [Thermodesulfobacteriaceae bacterium]|nr:NAD-dependent deacylase [Thermodesulfobacteriaceae bacterium]MCX8041487.1 NAD-dependent deacylase [Thermodesulfobacteriaceae bacterium]MDW8135957.1 NAD-dependent deacylase [Thermodesulfobacterium sp.]
MDLEKLIREVAEEINKNKEVVAFTGAGISVESGIPAFRGSQGLWEKYDPEEYAYISVFLRNPAKVWKMLRDMFSIALQAKPNTAHLVLAEMEKKGYLKAIITQNVDGLHQEAGSQKVIELHGNGRFLVCLSCHNRVPFLREHLEIEPYPVCQTCQKALKPDVVFFGEPLPEEALNSAYALAKSCKIFLIVGTSGVVYPAAQIPYYAKSKGATIVEVNLWESSYTYKLTDFFLKGKAGEIFDKLSKYLF